MGYFLFKIKLLYIIPPRIIVIAPAIIGNRRNGNETPPIITAIGLPPAGGSRQHLCESRYVPMSADTFQPQQQAWVITQVP